MRQDGGTGQWSRDVRRVFALCWVLGGRGVWRGFVGGVFWVPVDLVSLT